jgi:hypothetical protein
MLKYLKDCKFHIFLSVFYNVDQKVCIPHESKAMVDLSVDLPLTDINETIEAWLFDDEDYPECNRLVQRFAKRFTKKF